MGLIWVYNLPSLGGTEGARGTNLLRPSSEAELLLTSSTFLQAWDSRQKPSLAGSSLPNICLRTKPLSVLLEQGRSTSPSFSKHDIQYFIFQGDMQALPSPFLSVCSSFDPLLESTQQRRSTGPTGGAQSLKPGQ